MQQPLPGLMLLDEDRDSLGDEPQGCQGEGAAGGSQGGQHSDQIPAGELGAARLGPSDGESESKGQEGQPEGRWAEEPEGPIGQAGVQDDPQEAEAVGHDV